MALPQADINLVAVLVAAVVSYFIGFLWFSVLFGKAWLHLSGFTEKKMEEMKKKGMGKSYLLMFIGTFIMSYVLAHFVDYAGAVTFRDGMIAGFWLWLGFIAPVQLGMVLWQGKPWKLYFIETFHYLVALLVMAGILAVWV